MIFFYFYFVLRAFIMSVQLYVPAFTRVTTHLLLKIFAEKKGFLSSRDGYKQQQRRISNIQQRQSNEY